MDPQAITFVAQQLIVVIPVFLVCFAGFILALVFIRKYTVAAVLTIIAAIILAFGTLAAPLAQSYLVQRRAAYGWTMVQYGQFTTVVGISTNLIRAVGIMLLLIAVFVGRKAKAIT